MIIPAPPEDFTSLVRYSAQIGADRLLIQAAGGNTSLKHDGVMWIKASGTNLADAQKRNIFVPVDLAKIRLALDDPSIDADQTENFLLGQQALRPSIETSVHAVFEKRVVIHVHCVNTISYAIRKNAEAVLSRKLNGFNWCLVPYRKPGASLAASVRSHLQPDTEVVVLANHGLIVVADDVGAAEKLLAAVIDAIRVEPADPLKVDAETLQRLRVPGWHAPPEDASIHQVALHPERLAMAKRGSLYPDHVLFCGIGAQSWEGNFPDPADAPPFLLVAGAGAVMKDNASASSIALTECLGDVLMRVPVACDLDYLTLEQNAELLNWDAEKYRLALNA